MPYLFPRYSNTFQSVRYVNPEAPKGGYVRLQSASTTFDTFNPFSVHGVPISGWQRMFASLLASPLDDPTSAYSYAAQSFDIKGNSVIFHLRPDMHFSDGALITAQDIVFSYALLKDKGKPFYNTLFQGITSVVAQDVYTVIFTFNKVTPSPADIIIAGQIPILAAHYWSKVDFDAPLLDTPVTSGPYKVTKYSMNKFVKYMRVENWWGENLPINLGKYNFNKIIYQYFSDSNVALEAFKRHQFDWNIEWRVSAWEKEYNFPAVKKGRVHLSEVETPFIHGLNALFINTRREKFKNVYVRKALAIMFDFQWVNKRLLYGRYKRNTSIFMNTPYGISKKDDHDNDTNNFLPHNFSVCHTQKGDDIPHDTRVQKALEYMKKANWVLKDGVLVDKDTGDIFTLDIILERPGTVRLLMPYIKSLKQLGIQASIRLLDSTNFHHHKTNFDYDLIVSFHDPILIPGQELLSLWGSRTAHNLGSPNLSGVSENVVDKAIGKIMSASSEEDLKKYTYALDQVIQWGHFFIPMWHRDTLYIAYWNNIRHPGGMGMASIDTWWANATT